MSALVTPISGTLAPMQASIAVQQTPINVQKKSFKNAIRNYWLAYEEFLKLPEVFCQRNTEARLEKAKKHLKTLIEEHCIVFVARLTKDAMMNGELFKKGSLFRLDSNTRALNWALGKSDYVPQEVLVIELSFDSLERIRTSYNTFDSIDSVERNQEKMFGILSGMYKYNPVSEKVKKGQFVTALNKACCFTYPDIWNQTATKPESLPGQVGAFIDEIKYLDSLISKSSSWDQALVCAALMAVRRYGTNDPRLEEGLKYINDMACNTRGNTWDGITHIVEEWKTDKFLGDKNTKWEVLGNCVSYALYWIDKWMANETGMKPGRNWMDYATRYENSYSKRII